MNKRYTLILNKSYQALSVEGAKKSLGYLVGDEGKALDPQTYELFTFSEWVFAYLDLSPGFKIRIS